MLVVTVIDAEGMVVGRIATHIAKRLLAGEEVMVINAEKAVIVGKRESIYADEFERYNRGDWHGPWHPRMPDAMLRRKVRGMLPYKKTRGREAWRRLQAYIGVPRGVDAAKALKVEDARPSGAHPSVSLAEVAHYLGAKWRDAPTLLPRQRVTQEEKAKRKDETRAAIAEKRKAGAKEDGKKPEPAKVEKKAEPAKPAVKEAKPASKPAPAGVKKPEKKEGSTAAPASPAKKPEAKAEPKPKPAAGGDEKKVK
jgi:large subunit ribosomal protein L13